MFVPKLVVKTDTDWVLFERRMTLTGWPVLFSFTVYLGAKRES